MKYKPAPSQGPTFGALAEFTGLLWCVSNQSASDFGTSSVWQPINATYLSASVVWICLGRWVVFHPKSCGLSLSLSLSRDSAFWATTLLPQQVRTWDKGLTWSFRFSPKSVCRPRLEAWWVSKRLSLKADKSRANFGMQTRTKAKGRRDWIARYSFQLSFVLSGRSRESFRRLVHWPLVHLSHPPPPETLVSCNTLAPQVPRSTPTYSSRCTYVICYDHGVSVNIGRTWPLSRLRESGEHVLSL